MQRTFLDGKIPIERLKREHPLEYREMFGDDGEAK
jgi:hypothetical protein